MFRLTTVTPRSIAYAAVLVYDQTHLSFLFVLIYYELKARMSISGKDTWSASDLNFNYKTFYDTIVSLFEDDIDDLWAQDTLAWWNA